MQTLGVGVWIKKPLQLDTVGAFAFVAAYFMRRFLAFRRGALAFLGLFASISVLFLLPNMRRLR